MKKIILFLTFNFLLFSSLQAQVIFSEDFESGALPADWTINTSASDGGWNIGTATSLSSQFWAIPDNGSTNIIATNDDDCNCDKSEDYLILPVLDMTNQTYLTNQEYKSPF